MGKVSYKVYNWRQYNKGLCRRGSLSVWLSEEVLAHWLFAGPRSRGGCVLYADAAIDLCLTLKALYHLSLRQTQGLLQSVFSLLGLALPLPNYSTLCRRAAHLKVPLKAPLKRGIAELVVDGTGLKLYGEGEWKVRCHGWCRHRRWRRLQVALDAADQQIHAVQLHANSQTEGQVVEALMAQIHLPMQYFVGDGAYDKVGVCRYLCGRHMEPLIPPQHNALRDAKHREFLAPRDSTIDLIEALGRKQWKVEVGYHVRSLAETCLFRYKTILGPKLSARRLDQQKTEVSIGCKILNQMLALAKPLSRKVT
jgi:hypothetical protein